MTLRAALAASLCGLVFYAVWFPVTDTDLWWHLAAGRKLLEEGTFRRRDPFAADVLGQPWQNLHWLFQLLALGAYRAAGLTGVVLGKAALAALAAFVLLRASEAAAGLPDAPPSAALIQRAVAVLILGLPLFATRFLLLERPVVITLLLLALYLLVLERTLGGGRARVLWLLLPLQVIWVNAQGGLSLLGPAVVGATLAAEGGTAVAHRGARSSKVRELGAPRSSKVRELGAPRSSNVRALGLALLGVFGASLVNPYGPRGLGLPLLLLGRIDALGSDVFSLNISENVPPFLLERTQAASVWHFKWVAAAAFASLLLARPLAVVLSRLFLLGGFFGLALLAGRNVLLFEWVAGFCAAATLAPRLEALVRASSSRTGTPRWLAALPLSLAALALGGLAGLGVHRWRGRVEEGPIDLPAPFRVPVRAVERLRALELPGRVFNSVRYGGYLAFALHPRYRPGIDGRLVLRSASQFSEHLGLLDHPERFEAYRRAHDIRIAVLPSAYPDRYLPLLRVLCRDPRWRIVTTDGTETLLAWGEPAGASAVDLGSRAAVQGIVAELQRRYGALPGARDLALLHLGRLLAEVGELPRAREVLEPLATSAARGLLARVHYLSGRRSEARAAAEALLAAEPGAVNSLELLALIALDEGRHDLALELARRALERDPFDLGARRILLRLRAEAAAAPASVARPPDRGR